MDTQDWREWAVTLRRDEDEQQLAVHACTEAAAMTVVRYLLDAEQRTLEADA